MICYIIYIIIIYLFLFIYYYKCTFTLTKSLYQNKLLFLMMDSRRWKGALGPFGQLEIGALLLFLPGGLRQIPAALSQVPGYGQPWKIAAWGDWNGLRGFHGFHNQFDGPFWGLSAAEWFLEHPILAKSCLFDSSMRSSIQQKHAYEHLERLWAPVANRKGVSWLNFVPSSWPEGSRRDPQKLNVSACDDLVLHSNSV